MNIIKKLADDDSIRISWYYKSTDCLGPYQRFALWLQGCCRKCKGCISKENQDLYGGYTLKISDLADIIVSCKDTEGITISGGEPFYQADKLCILLSQIKKVRPEYGVIIYTGYILEELSDSEDRYVSELLEKYTDILIDGPYLSELDDNIGLRGSSNQKIISFTDHYNDIMNIYNNPSGRKSSIYLSNEKTQMVGIPSASVKKILNVN